VVSPGHEAARDCRLDLPWCFRVAAALSAGMADDRNPPTAIPVSAATGAIGSAAFQSLRSAARRNHVTARRPAASHPGEIGVYGGEALGQRVGVAASQVWPWLFAWTSPLVSSTTIIGPFLCAATRPVSQRRHRNGANQLRYRQLPLRRQHRDRRVRAGREQSSVPVLGGANRSGDALVSSSCQTAPITRLRRRPLSIGSIATTSRRIILAPPARHMMEFAAMRVADAVQLGLFNSERS
jgi:hypothetical protein